MSSDTKQILIVTGETSGDHHGAQVVTAIKRIDPRVMVRGVGGEALAKAGAELIYPSSKLAVVGILEVLSNFSNIWEAYQTIKRDIHQRRPDLVFLIDYPDFNLNIAKLAKKHKILVLYYISPQVWAWRRKRARKVAKIVDKMAVIFPFEVSFYEGVGLDAEFVGHPLADQEIPTQDADAFRRENGLASATPLIALLPGSRHGEIERILPLLLDAAVIIKRHHPAAEFVLPLAPGIDPGILEAHMQRRPVNVTVMKDAFYPILNACDIALVASGTATLQTALMEKPMVIVYRVAASTYTIGTLLVDVDCIGLANIVAGKKVVPELIQHHASPARIAAEAMQMLENPERMQSIQDELKKIRHQLGKGGAAQRVAEMACGMMT